jgi:List-Bact-rpt repeat protein
MDSDKSVSAAFVVGITLNVSITGGGTGSVNSTDGSIACGDAGGPCSSLNLPGTVVSLTAAPSNGSQFTAWSGGCSGSDPNACSVTLNSNQTVTANILLPPDFSVDPMTTSLTLTRGSQVSDTLTFPAQGGFAGMIGLQCSVSGPVPAPTCGISPNSVAPGKSATLTVNAGNLSAALAPRRVPQAGGILATLLPLAVFAWVLASCNEKKRRRLWALGVLILTAAIFPAACGSGGGGPPPPQNYTVTVTASSGPIQHSIQIKVTVQ